MLAVLGESDPRTIGQFRLQGRLGAGGMGAVYLGFAPDGQPAAVKMIHPGFADDAEFRARFRVEVQAARRVSGRCVAAVLDADVDAPQPWMATEYVEGVSLAAAVARRSRLDATTLTAFAAGLADGLVAVHAAGLVHRDLKPSNVLLSWDGPKIIDFGVARLGDASGPTGTGGVVGTVAWMSPEQLRGERARPASDVFAWGLCVAYAAGGRHPFPADTGPAIAMRMLSEPPDLTGVPTPLVHLVERALDKNPDARPNAVDLVGGLVGADVADPVAADAATRQVLANWQVPAQTDPDGLGPPDTANAASGTLALAVQPPGRWSQTPAPGSPARSAGVAAVSTTKPGRPAARGRAPLLVAAAVAALLTVGGLVVVLSPDGDANGSTATVAGGTAPASPATAATTATTTATTTAAPGTAGAASGSPAAAAVPSAESTPSAASSALAPASNAPPTTGAATGGTTPAVLPRATLSGRPLGTGVNAQVRSGGTGDVPLYAGPSTNTVFGPRRGGVADGSSLNLLCSVYGQSVTARGATSRLWNYTARGWVNDTYTRTGTTAPVVPACVGTLDAPLRGESAPNPRTGPFPVVTTSGQLAVRNAPRKTATQTAVLRQFDFIVISCHVNGDTVGPPPGLSATSDDWDRLSTGGYVPDSHVYSGTNSSAAPGC